MKTIQELIDFLRTCPPDYQVLIRTQFSTWVPVSFEEQKENQSVIIHTKRYSEQE